VMFCKICAKFCCSFVCRFRNKCLQVFLEHVRLVSPKMKANQAESQKTCFPLEMSITYRKCSSRFALLYFCLWERLLVSVIHFYTSI
jgi:hypothetical protein